jgi:small subunit ribosomal protein S15
MNSQTQVAKTEIFREFGGKETNTGSTEGQIALLTERINHISDHLQTRPKDHHNRQALLRLVGQRKRLLQYLSDQDINAYRALLEKLNLRK